MLPNGKVLCAFSPFGYRDGNNNPVYPRPTYFFEYDYTAGSNGAFNFVFPPVSSFPNPFGDNVPSYQSAMLALPDGTVLYSHCGSDLYIYTPDGSPVASGKPAITSVTQNRDGSYHLIGTGLNGISQGASYGDDLQMDSNYPLVRMTNSANSNVYYARTYNWSSTGVMTGTNVVTTEFTSPNNAPPGNYSLVVVANGIPSDPVSYNGPVWVDFNYTVGTETGTYAQPYDTLAKGTNAVSSGGTIAIKPGVSHETMTITKPMTIVAIGGSATIGQ